MMDSIVFGILTILIVSPAISICDDDLSDASSNAQGNSELNRDSTNDGGSSEQHHFVSHTDEALDDPWSFYRQLRAPSGFLGVRGKKDRQPVNYWELERNSLSSSPKRTPTQAFFGMRGKKYFDYKRAPSGFMGVRGKKDDYEDQSEENLQAELYRELQLEREKIASLVEDYMDEKEKRKPSGFVGLRGKKSVNNDDYFDFEKRAPMGFQGVRGKKSEFPNFIGIDDKRVPVAGFFGMRGKKQPGFQSSSSFFGIRKKPYLPYGKFVGVRGKKDQDGFIKMLHLDSDDLKQLGGLSSPQGRSDTAQDKRIGFIGMRG